MDCNVRNVSAYEAQAARLACVTEYGTRWRCSFHSCGSDQICQRRPFVSSVLFEQVRLKALDTFNIGHGWG
jgi:hypothetical protein